MQFSLIFIFCGIIMPLALILTGIRFGVGLKFFYIAHPISTVKSMLSGKGGFKSLSLALAGTLGVGNIVGVASAIYAGGIGSIFWMVLCAILSMGIKYVETFLAVKHRRWENGLYTGGAPLYIETAIKGKKGHVVASIFAFMCVSNSLITGNLVQVNAVCDILPLSKLSFGLLFALLFLVVIFFGVNRISTFTSVIIPLLSFSYIFITLYIILGNVAEIPKIIGQIIGEAFDVKSALGGIGGHSILTAMRYGISRGVLSNEAGCGTSPIAHASSENTPHIQGCLGIFEVFIDTVVLCPLTAFVVILSGFGREKSPMYAVFSAFSHFLGDLGGYYIAISCLLFAFATLLSQFYYGEKSLDYISKSRIIHTPYGILFVLICIFAPLIPNYDMWIISDKNIALLTTVNLVFLNLLLRKEVL